MALKKPANQDAPAERVIPHIAATRVFTRPDFTTTRPAGFMRHVTLKNAVMALGFATLVIFLASVLPPRIALLMGALAVLAGLVMLESASRRRWENDMVARLQNMHDDYERLVREVARSRNDVADLRRTLADAGDMARSQAKGGNGGSGEAAEQRMIKSIADRLSKLGASPAVEEIKPALVPEISAFARPESLSDEQVVKMVHAAVRQDRVDLFLQPIVSLPQRKTRFHEMFSRIRIGDDNYLPAERYIRIAMEQDVLPAIDNLLLLNALKHIRDADGDGSRGFFCNITSLTLNDPKFMGDLVEFISQHRLLAPRLVFELAQADLATMNAEVLQVLQGLARLGCRFSMDRVREIGFDYDHLDARHIRYIKIDAALMLSEMQQIGGLARMKRLKAALDHQGIDLIVEKIENERQVRELLDVGIDYGQGYLFGKPSAA